MSTTRDRVRRDSGLVLTPKPYKWNSGQRQMSGKATQYKRAPLLE